MLDPKWSLILAMKAELMQRDPLGQELTRLLANPPSDPWDDDWWDKRQDIEGELRRKYATGPLVAILDKPGEFGVAGLERPWTARRNWGGDLWHKKQWLIQGPGQSVPRPGELPTLTITLDLSRMTEWDLDRVARDLKKVIRLALKNCPRVASSDPPELAFLRTTTEMNFARDLGRYDRHMAQGLNYRLIAALETSNKPTPDSREHPRVGLPVARESSVEESVKRIYWAIRRKPYRARRRRIDTPAQGIEPYSCSREGHAKGQTCDKACPTWIAYKERLVLPSDRSGVGREILTKSGKISTPTE